MKKISAVCLVMSILFSCNNSSPEQMPEHDTDTLKHSEPFNGIFTGITPCADCPGINTAVIFSPDGNFSEHLEYLERDEHFSDSGKWKMQDSVITATYNEGNKRYFRVLSDSTVELLDGDGKEITGSIREHFLLKRTDTTIRK